MKGRQIEYHRVLKQLKKLEDKPYKDKNGRKRASCQLRLNELEIIMDRHNEGYPRPVRIFKPEPDKETSFAFQFREWQEAGMIPAGAFLEPIERDDFEGVNEEDTYERYMQELREDNQLAAILIARMYARTNPHVQLIWA